MECGHLERYEPAGKPVVFLGEISLPQISGEICLIPVAAKRKETSPDYVVKVRPRGGQYGETGKAWIKKFKSGNGTFFSMELDNPSMPGPVNVAGFPDDDQPKETDPKKPSQFTIRWGRPKRSAGPAPSASPDAGQALDDEIPY